MVAEPGPELIAHRAGNGPDTLLAAVGRADVVEIDVHLFRGRLEVRHAKVLWPTAILWEQWELVPRPTRLPVLTDIIDVVPPGLGVWLDLKSFTPRLARRVLAAVRGAPQVMIGSVTVSSRSWWTLRGFRSAGVRTMRSVGSRWQLGVVSLVRRWAPSDGIVIDERLVTPTVASRLATLTPWLAAWGVDDIDRAIELIGLGVRHLIIDDLELIDEIRRCFPAD